ncbi:MAG: DNA pilot protein [Microviridae sp.]|nr:MAG: DNA pilot protein [Microviridae sp.]
MGLLDSALGLIGPVGGSIISGIGGILGNQASAKEAEKNRNFQMEMSSTAHQREVEDLRKAGLNPILSATGGGGASTPSGATASQQNPLSGAGEGISRAAQTAADTKLKKEEAALPEWQIANMKWDAELKNSTVQLTDAKKLTELQTWANLKQDYRMKEFKGNLADSGSHFFNKWDKGVRDAVSGISQIEPAVIGQGILDNMKEYGTKAKDWISGIMKEHGGKGLYKTPSGNTSMGKGAVNGGANSARDPYGVPTDPAQRKKEWDIFQEMNRGVWPVKPAGR